MELLYYGFITVVGVLFSINNRLIKNQMIFFMIWLMVYCGLSFVVRYELDADIITYASRMSSSNFSIYYLKEPVVWLGQRYLFSYIQDPHTIFFIYDIIAGTILFKALYNFRVPQYLYFSILIFFPFILGMQNIYRQWLASVIFLYCFSLLWGNKTPLKIYLFFIISCLTHNVAAVFLPTLFINKSKIASQVACSFFLIVSFTGLYLGADTKSSANTGENLSTAYVILIALLLFLVISLHRGVIKVVRRIEYMLILILFFISLFGAILLSSAGSERLSMFCLLIVYPILSLLLEQRLKKIVLARITFIILGFAPIFIFSTSKFITS